MLLSAATRATFTVPRNGRRASGSVVPFRVVSVRMATTKVAMATVFRVEDRNLSQAKKKGHSRKIIGSVADGSDDAFDCRAMRHRCVDSMNDREHAICSGGDLASALRGHAPTESDDLLHDEMIDG